MEECYEQFMTKDYGNNQGTLNGLSSVILFLIAVSIFGMRNYGAAIFLVVSYLIIYIYSTRKFVEYEYELVGEDLTITRILNKRKRKKIAEINLRSLVEVNDKNSKYKVVNTFIDDKNLKKTIIYVKNKNEVKGYKIAMDQKMLRICRRVNPRAFNDILN